jgi:hypothetical protein
MTNFRRTRTNKQSTSFELHGVAMVAAAVQQKSAYRLAVPVKACLHLAMVDGFNDPNSKSCAGFCAQNLLVFNSRVVGDIRMGAGLCAQNLLSHRSRSSDFLAGRHPIDDERNLVRRYLPGRHKILSFHLLSFLVWGVEWVQEQYYRLSERGQNTSRALSPSQAYSLRLVNHCHLPHQQKPLLRFVPDPYIVGCIGRPASSQSSY